MDTFVICFLSLLGAFAMGYAALRPQTANIFRAFAFGLGVPWLMIFFINLIWRMGPETPFTWEGHAEMGPLTLVLIILGICWLWFGADYEDGSNNHRHSVR